VATVTSTAIHSKALHVSAFSPVRFVLLSPAPAWRLVSPLLPPIWAPMLLLLLLHGALCLLCCRPYGRPCSCSSMVSCVSTAAPHRGAHAPASAPQWCPVSPLLRPIGDAHTPASAPPWRPVSPILPLHGAPMLLLLLLHGALCLLCCLVTAMWPSLQQHYGAPFAPLAGVLLNLGLRSAKP